MSVQISIETYLDDAPARAQQNELEIKNEKIAVAIEENKKAAKESFNQVMGYMRGTYMMLQGVSQVMGVSIPQVFSGMVSVAISTIGTYKAIAAAIAATGPAGWIQATLMFSSLITAIISLNAAMTGQEDLSRMVGGLNTTLHGISALIGSVNF